LEIAQRRGATDTHGRFSFRLQKNQSAQLQLQPRTHNGQIYDAPTFWNLDIDEQRAAHGQLKIRHSWQRPVGGTVLNESFTEIIPRASRIRLPLILPPHESLEAGPLREKIHNTLVAFQHSTPQGIDHSYFCRNVESIEFIPLLIETYRKNEKGRESVIAGLKQIASILSELETGAREVQRCARSELHYPRGRLIYEVTQLCKWAHTSYEPKSDAVDALRHVQDKIDTYARMLIEFVLEQVSSDDRVLEIISELAQLGHSAIPNLIDQLALNPPNETHGMYHWSHALWSTGAHFSDLDKLIYSQNPVLVVLACEAIPNRELAGSRAITILERLKAVRPQIIDIVIQQRADMFINRLRAMR